MSTINQNASTVCPHCSYTCSTKARLTSHLRHGHPTESLLEIRPLKVGPQPTSYFINSSDTLCCFRNFCISRDLLGLRLSKMCTSLRIQSWSWPVNPKGASRTTITGEKRQRRIDERLTSRNLALR